MEEIQKTKTYDLEERTLSFAKDIRLFVSKLPRNIANMEDSKQLVRSSGSMGANYREANEALSKKDFAMRIKISRKETKETIFWLELISPLPENIREKERLIDEARQLMKIFGSIVEKSK